MTEYTAASVRAPTGRPGAPETGASTEADRRLIGSVKAAGWAVPVARRVEDLDPETLVGLAKLSRKGTAYLFAEGGGLVLAMAGSTADDRRRAIERLARLPERAYSSREASVLFDRGEAGSHYSEEPGFGNSATGAPKPGESELDEAAERFRAARFVRPSGERPLDVAAVQRRVRDLPLARASVRHAVAADPSDAIETLRRLVALTLVARRFSLALVRRTLAAERPWDTEAERRRMEARGMRLRREIVAGRKARRGKPIEPVPAAALDAGRRGRLAGEVPAEDPKLRASVERRRASGRAAYDTARALYLQRCPGLERKLLHLLRRDRPGLPRGHRAARRDRLPPVPQQRHPRPQVRDRQPVDGGRDRRGRGRGRRVGAGR